MAFFRKNICSARTTATSSVTPGERSVPDTSDLDNYLFDRETRMDKAWDFIADWPETRREVRFRSVPRQFTRSMPAISFSWSRLLQAISRPLSRVHSKTTALATQSSHRRLGLALGGGFARCLAHIGVFKVLEEEKIPVDFVAGTSAGAILGAAYCAGMSADELVETAASARFRDFAGWTLSRYGFYSSERMSNFCERVVKFKNFEDLKIPLAITATDVRTGEPVIFTKGPLLDPMRASCAYPGMFPPVEVDGRSLIDGMLAYLVPTTPLREMGADHVVGVYLSADRSRLPAPRHLFELIGQCFSIAEGKMRHLWQKDADLIIEPDIDGFPFDCFDRAKDLIANGEKAARAALPKLQRLLHLPKPRLIGLTSAT